MRASLILAAAVAVTACQKAEPKAAPAPAQTAAATTLEAWETFDPAFKGCEGG